MGVMLYRFRAQTLVPGLLLGGLWFGLTGLVHPAPAAAAADKKAQGAELFATRGCSHCHGNDGQGTDKAPALRDLRKKLASDKITDQIVRGGQGMPAFGDSLKAEEVEDLVAFLRAKKWITPPSVSSSTPPATSAPANDSH